LVGAPQETADDLLEDKGGAAMPTKLTEKQVVEIRERYADGSTTPELARDFGVSFRHVSGIVSGRYWRATGGPRTTRRFQVDGLSREQVAMIRLLDSIGLSHVAIGRMFQVSSTAVDQIAAAHTHKEPQ
jgi:hypothetical protein